MCIHKCRKIIDDMTFGVCFGLSYIVLYCERLAKRLVTCLVGVF